MSRTVFYSWQSDSPSNTNRSLIRDALDQAIKNLDQATDLEDAPRPNLELDHDTKGVPGTPELVNTILEKIENCLVFVPDLTFVGVTSDGKKKVPNSNVLIELGYAAKAIGFEKFIMVMNEYYGTPDEHMPFDLRHRRFPITYNLGPNEDPKARKKVKAQLAAQFERDIRLILHEEPPVVKAEFDAISPVFKSSSYLEDGEVLAEISEPDINQSVEACWHNGPQTFVRLLPTHNTARRYPHDIKRFFGQAPNVSALGPMRSGYIEANRYGAVIFNVPKSGLVRTFTQLFTSGEIWGIESLPEDVLNTKALPVPYICQQVIMSLDKYVQVSEKLLKNKPPFNAIIGISDIDGFGVAGEYGNLVGKCFQDEILIDRKVHSSSEVSQLVQDFAKLILKTCGA